MKGTDIRVRKSLSGLTIFLLLVACAFVVNGPGMPKAHALAPTVQQVTFNGATGSPCVAAACSFSLKFSSIISTGDLIVVGVDYLIHNNTPTCSGGATFSISDNESNTYTSAVSSGCNVVPGVSVLFYQGRIASTIAPSTHGITVTISWTCPTSLNGCYYITSLYDVTPLTQDVPSSAINSAGAGLTLSASPALTWNYPANGAFITSDFACNGSCNITSCGSGFSCLNVGFGTQALSQYATDATVASPTSATSTSSTGAGSGVFAVFSAVSPVNGPLVVVPCTFFQLQCWLYPAFFISVYLVLNMGIVLRGQVSEKDMQGVILEALTLGTMIAVVMGMLNIMIPLMATVIQVIRAIRA